MSNNHITINHRYGIWIVWVVVFFAASKLFIEGRLPCALKTW